MFATMAHGEPSRLGAIWLADVVERTRGTGGDVDATTRALGELHGVAKVQCEAPGGRCVARRGDGVIAVFDSADGAVRSALAVRDLFVSRRDLRTAGLTVRIAVHVGDVVEGAEGDLWGDAVTTLSRIAPLAEPDQVVLTDITYRLLQQRTTLTIEELGEHEIEGVAEPMRLYTASLLGDEEGPDLRHLLQEELTPLQLLNVEGVGGMGEIYLARDANLRRTLAVKVLRSELVADAHARARFFREAQVIAGLSHPNVIAVHAVGELKNGTPYFVMDYVEGGSLRDRLEREGPLSVPETRRIVGEVASALHAAHVRGVVHRDIKASNILFDTQSGRALVTDWGIAALDASTEMSPESRLTRTGAVVGSPQYMSPEQLAGDDVGSESDVYSLGLLAYELLTGHGPFAADTPRALMVAHLRDAPEPLSMSRPDVDPELETVVARCLSKEPWARPTAEEVARRFAPGAEAILEWPPPGLAPLRGQGAAMLFSALMGVTMIVIPVLVAFAARMDWVGRSLFRNLTTGPQGVTVTVGLVMIGPLVFGLFLAYTSRRVGLVIDTLKASRAWSQKDPMRVALGLGYGWRTVLEVLDDRWGDFGNLLAGRREYAILDATARGRIRKRKLRRSGLRWTAVVALPFTVVVAVYLVSAHVSSVSLGLALGLGPPLVLWLASLLLVEPNAVRLARGKLERRSLPAEIAGPEVDAWKEALTRVVGTEGPEPGRPTSSRTWFAFQAAQTVFFAVPYMFFLSVLLALAAGSIRNSRGSYDATRALFTRLRAASGFQLPSDSSVTPEEARRLVAQVVAWDPGLTPWRGGRPGQETVQGSALPGSALAQPYSLSPGAVVPTSLDGVSRVEMAYLAGFTGDPRFPAFERLARAVGYDDGVPERYSATMLPSDLPDASPMGALREVALHKLAQAGYQIATGHRAQADTTLRQIYSVGSLLAWGSDDLNVALLGRNVATLGLNALRQLRVDGTSGAAAGQTPEAWARPSPPTSTDVVGQPFQDWLARAMALAADSTVPRSLRLAIVANVHGAAECGSLEGMLFGSPPEVRALDDAVRDELVRGPADAAYVDLAINETTRTYARLRTASRQELRDFLGTEDVFVYTMMRVAAKAFRNPRLLTCAVRRSTG
ncbi:MAG: protein kinase [Gemmatimonadetes bacterium]|nr:protein kinase [Gemmatimonadota bacterium]